MNIKRVTDWNINFKTQSSYSSGKTWKRDFFERNQGKPGKLREFSDHFYNLRENSGNFILPNISDQIGGALRINEASKWINGTHSPSTIISLFVKLLYLTPWSGLFCSLKSFFHDVSHSFFSSYSREKFLKILDIFLRTKDSDNAKSISVAEWQKYLELLLPTLDGFMNIWLFILIIWLFLLIIWLYDKIKQISTCSGNVISTLGNHFCVSKQSFWTLPVMEC